MQNQITKTLSSLGLSEKEIKIYLGLLSTGTTAASIVAKKTNLPRSTARFTCEQLVKKGLCSSVQKGNTLLFTPESPDRLLYFIEEQREKLEHEEAQTNRIIGELKKMMNPHSVLPKVQFFEGKEGLIKLYEQILDLESPIDSFEDRGEMANFISKYVPQFIKKRKERKIYNRVICPAKNPINKNSQEELRETRNLDEKKFPLSCDIKICNNQVSIFSFEKNTAVGVAIKHKDIAQNFRLLFDAMWKHLSH